jgi:transposase
MSELENIDPDALADTTDSKAVKRLVIALTYDDGAPVDTPSNRHGIARPTMYFWLDRFEEGSIADAIHDDSRPGRPTLLDEYERKHLTEVLRHRPSNIGLNRNLGYPS